MAKKFFKGRRTKEIKEFEEDVLEIARVTRVVKGGRRLRFRATVVVGNKKGKVGVGIGKSIEIASAIQKAVSKAKQNLIQVPLTDINSIPHEVKYKFKAAKILIMPAFEGTGIIAGGAMRKIAELAGIKNMMGKTFGTTNKLINAQAVIQAFQSLKEVQKKEHKNEKKIESKKIPHKKIEEKEIKNNRNEKTQLKKEVIKKTEKKTAKK